MEFLERQTHVDKLAALLRAASGGCGQTVLIAGEAGIGKTTLVERFTDEYCRAARVLWGTCDALFTPQPLGPLHEMVRQGPAELRALLDGGCDWFALASALLDWLSRSPTPVVLVVEDAHWADQATLDLLKFLGRRIERTRALLLVTYRDNELGPQHPLRLVLGDLPARTSTRQTLLPLSEAAVEQLAGQAGRAADGLYATTGGNPFFVTEVLAHEADGLPATVRDAVLGRAARLSPEARQVLDLASIMPGAFEAALLGGAAGEAVAECMKHGLLCMDGALVSFRHDLARRALVDALAPPRARELHGQVLATLLAGGEEQVALARLAHHATGAGDAASVLRFAAAAARQASALGAHCQAAAHYATALCYADELPAEERAALLEGGSYECFLIGELDAAIAARHRATEIWRELNNAARGGECLRWLARLYWYNSKSAEAERYAGEAISMLESLAPGPALALAYGLRAALATNRGQTATALDWGRRALALAEQLGAADAAVRLLNIVATAQFRSGDQAALALLEGALAQALALKQHDTVGSIYTNIIQALVERRNYAAALPYMGACLAYTSANDLDTYTVCLLVWRARQRFEQGRWREAEQDNDEVLREWHGSSAVRVIGSITLGHLQARRGNAEAAELLDHARQFALPTGEAQRIGPLAAALAEAAWWAGDPEQVVALAQPGYELALQYGNAWMVGQLAYWIWRAGGAEPDPARLALPYRLMVQGDWSGAASEWALLDCPFEQALALSAGDRVAQLAALAIFDDLGAKPAAAELRRTLRMAGLKGIPRGPRAATRASRFGLTGREHDVLTLLGEGLSNAEIAGRLSISAKTVDHHVSAILAKVGARSRGEAVAAARGL